MKGITILLFLLAATVGCAQRTPQQAIEELLPAYFQNLTAQIQILGHESDSAKWANVRAGVLKNNFTTDSVRVPDLLVTEDFYREQRPTTNVQSLLQKMPVYFWKGFQFEMDGKAATIQEVKVQDTTLTANVTLPVSVRGIARQGRKSQRLGEKMKITLEGQWKNQKIMDLKIKDIQYAGEWLYGEPLTQKKAQEIEKQVLKLVKQLLSSSSSDSLRQAACSQLKKNLENDTIFFVRTDKVLIPVSIKECKRPDSLGIQELEKLKIEEFTLDYLTDFYRGTNQLYIGQRTRLEKVKPNEVGEKWHEASKKELTPVSEAIAKSQLSDWKISRLIIQL